MLAKEDLFKQLKRLQEENEKAKEYIKDLQVRKDEYYLRTLDYEAKISYLIQALEEIKNITEKLITETPEYNSCYYKDECGDNCTPKNKVKLSIVVMKILIRF